MKPFVRASLFAALALATTLAGCAKSRRPSSGRADAAPAAGAEARKPAEDSRPAAARDAPAGNPRGPQVRSTEPRRVPVIRQTGRLDAPLDYLVVEPPHLPSDAPLVLALHGRGDRAERFANLAEDVGLPVRTVVLQGPLGFGMREGRQWFRMGPEVHADVRQAAELLRRQIRYLRALYPGAPRPILYGFSQGAALALEAVVGFPQELAGAAGLSGFLVSAPQADRAPTELPVLVTIGRRDKIIGPEKTRDAVEELRKLGHRVQVHEFNGGHSMPRTVQRRLREFLVEAAGL